MIRRAKPLLALAGLLVLAATAAAQFSYVPYYGKNKVNYESFAWKSYATEHFKVFFYDENPGLLKNVVRHGRERLPQGQRRPQARSWPSPSRSCTTRR